MQKRYMYIWFRYLLSDWLLIKHPQLNEVPVAFVKQERNKVRIHAVNAVAKNQGIEIGMAAADAKAIIPTIKVIDAVDGQEAKLLRKFGLWCIGFTPFVAVDLPDGLILDITGCAHLFKGEAGYYQKMISQLREGKFDTRAAIADTIGAAWAAARYSNVEILESGQQMELLKKFPPVSLRLTSETLDRLQKLGFFTVESLMKIPSKTLKQRCGEELPVRLSQALGFRDEQITPLIAPVPYVERLACLEPVRTAPAILIAIENLLKSLCERLSNESNGLRKAVLNCYGVDGKLQKVQISTNKGSYFVPHLMKLFGLQVPKIMPGLGIELFVLEASRVEAVEHQQEEMWIGEQGLKDKCLVELIDRIAGKMGADVIKRYLPTESFWPEHSFQLTQSITEIPQTNWNKHRVRPMHLLKMPMPIKVMALLPDYPPKQFLFKDKLYEVVKADGPERIEYEWWRGEQLHRDYYVVEDNKGQRYWLFRSGHYGQVDSKWFLHGYFA
jgi:protein ImuB